MKKLEKGKKGKVVRLIPVDEPIEEVWWRKNSEIEHMRILDELKTGSFPTCLRELHSYLEFLREEYRFIDDVLSGLLQQLRGGKEAEEFLEAWKLLIQNPN